MVEVAEPDEQDDQGAEDLEQVFKKINLSFDFSSIIFLTLFPIHFASNFS